MADEKILYIRKWLKKHLDEDRYEHTLGVAYTAICLAMRYDADMEKAETAGLLHDCAKCIPDEIKLVKCKEKGIEISETERQNPSLLHAKLGAYYAAKKFNISDREILDAITFHTTGRPGMSKIEQIIFVADYIEPRRFKAQNLPFLRKLAFLDLDRACLCILDQTINYLKGKKNLITDERSREAWAYYKQLCEEKK